MLRSWLIERPFIGGRYSKVSLLLLLLCLLSALVISVASTSVVSAGPTPMRPFGFESKDVTSPDGLSYTTYSGTSVTTITGVSGQCQLVRRKPKEKQNAQDENLARPVYLC